MRLFIYIAVVLLLCACSNSEGVPTSPQSSPVDVVDDSLAGMVRVNSIDAIAVLGTTDNDARANEQPEMKVKFSYDFSIGQHEVTCGEFDSLMK